VIYSKWFDVYSKDKRCSVQITSRLEAAEELNKRLKEQSISAQPTGPMVENDQLKKQKKNRIRRFAHPDCHGSGCRTYNLQEAGKDLHLSPDVLAQSSSPDYEMEWWQIGKN